MAMLKLHLFKEEKDLASLLDGPLTGIKHLMHSPSSQFSSTGLMIFLSVVFINVRNITKFADTK